jgi:hypothetical protein
VIACSGTGQDGEFKEGATWPIPRFAVEYCDNNGPCPDQEFDCDASDSNNMMLDNLTGLVWTKDANLPAGTKTWADAFTYANDASVCGYTDWRIPNREEFRSLAHYGTSTPPSWLQTEGGFINVQPSSYWTSTTFATSTYQAWYFLMANCHSNYCHYGSVAPTGKTQLLYVWPVRGGCIAHFSDFDPETFWAAGYIKNMYCKGITSGCTQNPLNYCPNNDVTRAAMSAFIIRAKFGENFTYSPTPYFTDVPPSNQFFKYIQKMNEEGITTGYSDQTYRPSLNVTRAAMAAFLSRAFLGMP